MKLTAALIELGTELLLLLIGRGVYRTENPQESVLFLSEDYTGLDAAKICRVTGRRIMYWSIPFFIGLVIDLFDPVGSLIAAFGLMLAGVVYHVVDMNRNRMTKYSR